MYTDRIGSDLIRLTSTWAFSSSKSFAFCCACLICCGSCRRRWMFAIEKFQRIDTRRCCEKWQSQSPFAFPFAISFNELPLVDVSLFVYTIKQTHAPLSEFIHTISSDWILRSDHFLDQLLPCRLSVDCLTVVHFKRLSRTSHQTVADYTLKAPKQESALIGMIWWFWLNAVELFAFGFGRRSNSLRDQDGKSSHESWTEGDDETFERPNSYDRQNGRWKTIHQDDATSWCLRKLLLWLMAAKYFDKRSRRQLSPGRVSPVIVLLGLSRNLSTNWSSLTFVFADSKF